MKNNKRIIQNIFKSAYPQLIKKKHPIKDHKAIRALMYCQTEEQGYHLLSCPEGHESQKQLHSCRHRSCPICADKARCDWIEKQKEHLLNCPHHHVVFTLPHEYIPLWLYNRKWMTQHFFKACRDTLMALLEDKRYLGATPGILMALHTWGRQLTMHPHMHCLVTSGGMDASDKWHSTSNDFLLPIHVVKSLFRGKMQSYIKKAFFKKELNLCAEWDGVSFLKMHRSLYKKQWSIRIQEQYAHGQGVMLYLARYMKGGPINPKQIIQCTHKGIVFRYKDHHDQKIKQLSISMPEFIRRILWHVPEPHVHVVRHYGLYAAQCREKTRKCHALFGRVKDILGETGEKIINEVHWICAICGASMKRVYSVYAKKWNENSYISVWRHRPVQQDVRADAIYGIGPDG